MYDTYNVGGRNPTYLYKIDISPGDNGIQFR